MRPFFLAEAFLKVAQLSAAQAREASILRYRRQQRPFADVPQLPQHSN
jgi:hypothetical protein